MRFENITKDWRNTRPGVWHQPIRTFRNGKRVREWKIYYETKCAYCGDKCLIPTKRHKYCSVICGNNAIKKFGGEQNRWKGGKARIASGYVMILLSRNPRKYVFEHRHIMEQLLKRSLTTHEVVHHKNGIRDDNRLENLELMTRAQHCALHEPNGRCR